MSTFVENQTLHADTCARCGILFAMPEHLVESLRKSHNTFYCPAGHPLKYGGRSDEEQLKSEVARLQTNIERKEALIAEQRLTNEQLEKSRNACKGHYRRICRRIKSGVCPCCNRTFQNLGSHMKTKHPDMATEPKES